MSYEVVWGDWDHPNPGQYIRDDGTEVFRTGPRTWTLTWRNGDMNFRTARAAKSYADRH